MNQPLKVLIVEDSEDDAKLMLRALRRGGFDATHRRVQTAAEVETALAGERWDAVISDFKLPGFTGMDALRIFRSTGIDIPFILISGTIGEETAVDAMKAGASDYMMKSGLTRLAPALERELKEAQIRAAHRRAQEALAESEQRFRQMAESIRDAFFLVDADSNRMLYISPAYEEIWGRSCESLYANPISWTEAIHPDDRASTYDKYKQGMSAGKLEYEYRIVRPDGSMRWIETRGFPVRDGAGRIIRIAAVAEDITDRKVAQTKIRRLNRVYAVLSGINALIVRVRDRNELFGEACRIAIEEGGLHMSMIAIADRNAMRIVPVASAGVDGELLTAIDIHLSSSGDAPTGETAFARVIREKKGIVSSVSQDNPTVMFGRKFSGSTAVLPLVVSDEAVGVLALYADETGFFDDEELKLLTGLAGDIAFAIDHIDKQERLHAAEEQFRGLVEQAIAGICILQDGKIVYVNPRGAEILGQGSTDELIGTDPLQWIAEPDRGKVAENVRRLLDGEARSATFDFHAVRRDGVVIQVGANSARATHEGRPAIISMLQDISEKKRAEAQIQRYVAQIENAFMSTVQVVTTLGEMRDPYTAGHQRRVAEIAVAIGAELGFDARRQEGLRVAGFLHDIGKIRIPAEILTKPGKLSGFEFQLVQGHAQASYDVLKGVDFPWPVAEVALQHHERMDGSGYPQGLRGEAILFEARIMALADVVEAMSSHRPYRPGLGIDAALSEIERGRGSAYDPVVVDACLMLFREKGYAIPG